jgi:4-amino-4-deoxy-L-arabinose transferase
LNQLFKNKYLIILILLIGLFLRVRLSQDKCVHKWDERYHALVAKNLLKHPLKPTLYETSLFAYDYKQWYANHLWLHKQPLPLWLIAASYAVFSSGDLQTRIPSILLSLLAIYVTYLLGKNLFNDKVGLLSAFFMSINGLVIEMVAGRVATDHYDILYMVFTEISILFALISAQKNKIFYAFLSGIFIGLAILTKWLPCLVIIPVHVCFLLNSERSVKTIIKQISSSLLSAALVSIPWQIFIVMHYPTEALWSYHYNWLHTIQILDGQGGNFFYYINKIRINYSEIIYLPLIYFGFLYTKLKFKNRIHLAILIWIFVPILFFSLIQTKMQGYILFVSPALFIVTSKFFFDLKDKLIKTTNRKWLKYVCVLICVLVIILPIRYCLERTSFGFGESNCENYIENYRSFQGKLSEKCVVLNVKEPIEFMFYNDCIAYSIKSISQEEFKRIGSLGFTIFTIDDSNTTLIRLNSLGY